MISSNLYSRERYLNSPNDIIPLKDIQKLGLFSTRELRSNNLLSSSIKYDKNSLILNNSDGNINIDNHTSNGYDYHVMSTSPPDNLKKSKINIEYDNKILLLKKKLQTLKEQNKERSNNINMMKLRIIKLKNEEKSSLHELEKTKNRIIKIKSNRININKSYKKNDTKKINLNLSIISKDNQNNKTLNIGNGIIKKSQILSKIKNNLINSKKYNSFRNNLNCENKNNKYSQNNNLVGELILPKMKYFITKNGINNSYNMLNIDEINNGSNNENLKINSSMIKKKSKINKDYLRNNMKKNIIKQLKEDELKKRKIEEEIKQIEKEQFELCLNFSLDLSKSNMNTIKKKTNKKYVNDENEENVDDDNDNNLFLIYFKFNFS